VFAALAAASADFSRGMRLAGASAALHKASRAPIVPRDRAWLDRQLVRARAALGVAGVERALREGAELDTDHAIAAALELRDPRTVTPPSSRRARDVPTQREQEVAVLVAQGLSNPQIAGELVIGERTVQTHVGNILSRLGLSSRAQVATWVTERHLGTKDPLALSADRRRPSATCGARVSP
jgi:DNA-binding CsgD family transcriptional regulator